jgi:hypothetical protein
MGKGMQHLVDSEHPRSPRGRHRARRKTTPRRTIRTAFLVVILLAAFVGVGWVLAAAIGSNGGHQSTSQNVLGSEDPATAWIHANLPRDARILFDGPAPPPGYPSASLDEAGHDWQRFDYFITSDTNIVPPSDDSAAAVWRSSTPVAIFVALQVRRIFASTPTELPQARDADRADRLTAGTALLANPGIDASPDATAILARGGLDIRAATALSVLAANMRVQLDDIKVVPEEAAAGMPARSITVRTPDTAQATKALSGLTIPFRPDEVGTGDNGTLRLHWPLSVTPVPKVK